MSSAYCTNVHDLSIVCGKSFTYKLNSSGPSTVPWRTPCSNLSQSECSPFTIVNCCLFFRNDLIRVVADCSKPM